MLKSLLAAVVTLALLTCPFPARAYEKTILKVGMGDPIDSEMGAIGTRFKEVVEARSEGKVEVQLFPSGQLGDETEMIQNVRAGNLDIAVVGIANTVPFVKKLGILTMPYLFDDMYDVVRATTGPAGIRQKPSPLVSVRSAPHIRGQRLHLMSGGCGSPAPGPRPSSGGGTGWYTGRWLPAPPARPPSPPGPGCRTGR